jgi:hypothetical protein
MSDNRIGNINIGGSVNQVYGSAVNTGNIINISGDFVAGDKVSNAIDQLPDASLKKLLTIIQRTIEEDTALTDEDKVEALEQVQSLAVAGKNPQDSSLQKTAKLAIKILKGTIVSLPDTSNLVEVCAEVLPLVVKALQL